MSEESLHKLLFKKFCKIIIDYLTNENLVQIGEHSLSLDESTNFINDHLSLVNERVQEMIESYDAEGYIEELFNVQDEWIKEVIFIGDLYQNMKHMRF